MDVSTYDHTFENDSSGAMTAPPENLDIIVVIPAYAEPHLVDTLHSLYSCDRRNLSVEVLVVINQPEDAQESAVKMNSESLSTCRAFAQRYGRRDFALHATRVMLPVRKAGVGLARKIGMDQALRRFQQIGKDGIIVNLDADCTCAPNYFREIFQFFKGKMFEAAGIYFEHPMPSDEHERQAIIDYELHLRYFINAQRYMQLPFAYHTIGSSMAVTAAGYQKMGGMNSRKAGEDFYFLHKFIAVGRFGEVLTTTVYPQGRPSHRVPFGTGRAVGKILSGSAQLTYHLKPILTLDGLEHRLDVLYKTRDVERWCQGLPDPLQSFFLQGGWISKFEEIKKETSNSSTFKNRFFQRFNAFQLMKYLHFCRSWYPDLPVLKPASQLAQLIDPEIAGGEAWDLLQWYRWVDQSRR